MTGADRESQIELSLTVQNQVQARELEAAWKEIVSGERLSYAEALENGQEGIVEQARVALQLIEEAVRKHLGTGQAKVLVQFLAGVYNGSDYPFDLTSLRSLDTRLATACLAYLNYDRLGRQEVHHHLAGGEGTLTTWLKESGVQMRSI